MFSCHSRWVGFGAACSRWYLHVSPLLEVMNSPMSHQQLPPPPPAEKNQAFFEVTPLLIPDPGLLVGFFRHGAASAGVSTYTNGDVKSALAFWGFASSCSADSSACSSKSKRQQVPLFSFIHVRRASRLPTSNAAKAFHVPTVWYIVEN